MTHNNQINVSVKGSIVSLTNNVQFIINSDIYGGENFESQASMKINAPAYFSSRGKLITRDDYMSYFRALSSPMTVQTAMVFGQHDIEDTIGFMHPLCQNNILYCLAGHVYIKNPSGNWTIRNVLTENDYNTTDTFSLYGDKYLEHLCDYVKLLKSYQGFYNCQYSNNPQDQWLRNIQLINKNCQFNSEINSVILSLPPYIQYFDAVGTVYVKPLTDIEKYMNEMQNRVYEYLDSRVSTHKKIYKSEIIKLYNEHPATVSTDIDFKISEIIKSEVKNYYWSKTSTPAFEFKQDKSLESYTSVINTYTEEAGKPDKDSQLIAQYGEGWWNVLKLPNIDTYGNKMLSKMFEERSIRVDILNITNVNGVDTKTIINTNTFSAEVSEDENFIILTPKSIQENKNITLEAIQQFNVILPNTNDFYSSSTFSTHKTDEYGLSETQIGEIEDYINKWLSEELYTTTSAQRAINLPYTVRSANVDTRSETIMRKGHIILDNNMTLSENSFWNYIVPAIIEKYYPSIGEASDIYGTEWTHATNLIMDIYPLIKPGICDSILDNNNNITNFSTQMERACLRNIINVQYYQDN